MNRKVIASFMIGVTALVAALAWSLVESGQPLRQVLLSTFLLWLLLLTPIVGAWWSLRGRSARPISVRQTFDHVRRRYSTANILLLFVLSPLLVGLIYLIAYPSLALVIAVVVIIAINIAVLVRSR